MLARIYTKSRIQMEAGQGHVVPPGRPSTSPTFSMPVQAPFFTPTGLQFLRAGSNEILSLYSNRGRILCATSRTSRVCDISGQVQIILLDPPCSIPLGATFSTLHAQKHRISVLRPGRSLFPYAWLYGLASFPAISAWVPNENESIPSLCTSLQCTSSTKCSLPGSSCWQLVFQTQSPGSCIPELDCNVIEDKSPRSLTD
jgi:hypothetical protein